MGGFQKLLIGAVLLGLGAGVLAHPGHPPIVPPQVNFITPKTIPFELFRDQRIVLQGTVNGQPTPMLLDSGAGITTIDTAFAQQLNLKGGTAIKANGVGGGVSAQLIGGVSLTAGSLHMDRLTVAVIDLSAIARSVDHPIPIILGRDAFKAGIVSIDFPHRKIRFSDRQDFTPPAGATRMALGDKGTIKTLKVAIANLPPVDADLDLGNGGSLLISNSYWKSQAIFSSLPHAQTQIGGVGGLKIARRTTVPLVEFAGRRFLNVPADLHENPQALPTEGVNVGIDMFKPFVVAIDFTGNALYISGPTEVTNLPRERAGVRTELAGDRLKAVYVSPDGPAAVAGLKTGDEIIAVDGRKIGPNYYDQPEWIYSTAGRNVELTLADGSRRSATLRDYY